MGGGQPGGNLAGNETLAKANNLARMLRWLACSALPDEYAQFSQKENERSEASTFAIFWQRAEDMV